MRRLLVVLIFIATLIPAIAMGQQTGHFGANTGLAYTCNTPGNPPCLDTNGNLMPDKLVTKASGTQTLSSGVTTTVIFLNVVQDTGAGWNAANNWYTIPVTGTYQFTACQDITATTIPAETFVIDKNAGTVLAKNLSQGLATATERADCISVQDLFTAGDHIYTQTTVTGTGAITLVAPTAFRGNMVY